MSSERHHPQRLSKGERGRRIDAICIAGNQPIRLPRPMSLIQAYLWLVYCLGGGLLIVALSTPLLGGWDLAAGFVFSALSLKMSYWLGAPRQYPRSTVDPESHDTYIYLSDNPVARTEELDDSVMIDRDSGGSVVGIEVLGSEALGCSKMRP